jgi:hypothetical protein
MTKEYYVYAHYCRGYSAPVYIGKGKLYRAWCFKKRSEKWKSVTGGKPDEVVILQDKMSEPCALTLERVIIDFWGKGLLSNIASSGVGQNGIRQTPESNEKRRAALTGERNHNYGKPLPAHVKEAARLKNKGSIHSPETRAKRSEKVSGKKHPQLDTKTYRFIHESGEVFEGLRFDFIKQHSLSPPKVCNVISGRRQTHKGWKLS